MSFTLNVFILIIAAIGVFLSYKWIKHDNGYEPKIVFWAAIGGLLTAGFNVSSDALNIEVLRENIFATIVLAIALGYAISYLVRASDIFIDWDKRPYIKLEHRKKTKDEFAEAFEKGNEVIFLTIMSQHTRKQIEPYLKKAKSTRTKINILTFDPNAPTEVVESLQKHLKDSGATTISTKKQIEEAFQEWKNFESQYPNIIEVRKYNSIPTMQGLFVKDKFISIELMTYETLPDDRAGALIYKDISPKLFDLIYQKYETLWIDAQR